MQVTVKRLAAALKTLKPAIEKNRNSPILQCVLVEARNKELRLKATNMELAFSLLLPGEGEDGFILAVEFKPFEAAIKAMPKAGLVDLERADDGSLSIACQGRSLTVPMMDAEKFPELPQRPMRVDSPHLFVTLDKRTLIAASKDGTKPTLSGMCLALDRGELACTDGFRLAVTQIGTQLKGGPAPIRLILPVEAPLFDGPKEITWDAATVYWTEPGLEGSIRRITSGNYPSYEKVLPPGLERAVTVDRKAFQEALAFVGTKADLYNKDVRLSFEFPNLTLSFMHPDTGEAKTSIPFTGDREAFDLLFNIHYLEQLAKTSKTEELTYRFKDEIGTGCWDGWYFMKPAGMAK